MDQELEIWRSYHKEVMGCGPEKLTHIGLYFVRFLQKITNWFIFINLLFGFENNFRLVSSKHYNLQKILSEEIQRVLHP